MNVIRIQRERSGQEVLDAFRAAATFQETPALKWEAYGYALSSGIATGENTFSPMRGYYATPAHLHKQSPISRLLRGRRTGIWETVPGGDLSRFETQIQLHALQPEKRFAEVMVTLTHLSPVSQGRHLDFVQIIHDPDAEEFASFRSAYDRIIHHFLLRLGRS